jgi:hypothetical protein
VHRPSPRRWQERCVIILPNIQAQRPSARREFLSQRPVSDQQQLQPRILIRQPGESIDQE